MPYKNPEKQKEWRDKNKQYIANYRKEYCKNEKNHEKIIKYFRDYRKENKEKLNKYAREWYLIHREEQRERGRLYGKKNLKQSYLRKKLWRLNNPDKYKETCRAYMKNNLNARIANGLRARVILAVKSQSAQKMGNTEKLLGCTIPELIDYIEKKFLEGMNWKNWGKISFFTRTWNIDHIMPCSAFNLSDLEEQKKCFNYTNLQPLWAFDNLSKGKKIYGAS